MQLTCCGDAVATWLWLKERGVGPPNPEVWRTGRSARHLCELHFEVPFAMHSTALTHTKIHSWVNTEGREVACCYSVLHHTSPPFQLSKGLPTAEAIVLKER